MSTVRLSETVILKLMPEQVSKDLNTDKLYIYDTQSNGAKHLISDDIEVNSREYNSAPYMENVLLSPTPYFYPDFEDPDYHNNREVSVLLNDTTLPEIEYRKCRLYFVNGFTYDSDVYALSLSMYLRKQDNNRVYLSNLIDFYNNSNIGIATDTLFYEGNLYNQYIEFYIADIDYLYSSDVADVETLTEYIFSSDRPSVINVEYAIIKSDNVQDIVKDGKTFKRINRSEINSTAINYTLADEDLFIFVDNIDNRYLSFKMDHTRYDIESYLNTLKESTEVYELMYDVSINLYDSSGDSLGLISYNISNNIDMFSFISYRPILPEETDHISLEITGKCINISTGATITRSTTINITDVTEMKPKEPLSISVTSNDVYNKIQKNIIKQDFIKDVPTTVLIKKKVYVQMVESNVLSLHEVNFKVKVFDIADIDIKNVSETYLKIGDKKIVSELTDKTVFKIEGNMYSTEATKYYVLDSNDEIITYGSIEKI